MISPMSHIDFKKGHVAVSNLGVKGNYRYHFLIILFWSKGLSFNPNQCHIPSMGPMILKKQKQNFGYTSRDATFPTFFLDFLLFSENITFIMSL